MKNLWTKKKNKGWTANHLQRNSLREPEVKKGFLIIALLTVVGIGTLMTSAMYSYRWLCQSDFFQMSSIDISGNQEVDRETIIRLAGIDVHTNLLALDIDAIVPRIQGYGWIEAVTISKEWPSHLHIAVRERRPLALLNTPKGLFYVDGKGEPFAAPSGQAELDFPVISGLENSLSFKGKAVQVNAPEKMQAALQFINYAIRGTPALPAQNISEVNCAGDQGVILYLADRPFPIFLGKELGKKTYNRLAKVLYWLYKKKEFQSVAYIHLDYMDNKVLVGKEIGRETVEIMGNPPGERGLYSALRKWMLLRYI